MTPANDMRVPMIFAAPALFFMFSDSTLNEVCIPGFQTAQEDQKQEMKNVWILEHLSKTAMRKVSTGAMLVKVIANVAVVYCSP